MSNITPLYKPKEATEEILNFLDALRDTSEYNMASPEVRQSIESQFSLSKTVARSVHQYWMFSFGERHPK